MTVIVTADWHVNSPLGMCPPEIPLDDGGIYRPSRGQQWLWSCWLDFWAYAAELPGRKVAVILGDIYENYHHGSVQIITLNEATEMEAGLAVAGPMLAVVNETWVIRGTEAHTGGAGFKEELFARRVGARRNKDLGTWSWWHLARAWGQVKFDLSHHPQTASYLEHTRDWAAARQATYTCLEYDSDGVARPDVILRAHCHRHGKGFYHDTFCAFCPPWQLTTADRKSVV